MTKLQKKVDMLKTNSSKLHKSTKYVNISSTAQKYARKEHLLNDRELHF